MPKGEATILVWFIVKKGADTSRRFAAGWFDLDDVGT